MNLLYWFFCFTVSLLHSMFQCVEKKNCQLAQWVFIQLIKRNAADELSCGVRNWIEFCRFVLMMATTTHLFIRRMCVVLSPLNSSSSSNDGRRQHPHQRTVQCEWVCWMPCVFLSLERTCVVSLNFFFPVFSPFSHQQWPFQLMRFPEMCNVMSQMLSKRLYLRFDLSCR